MRVRQQPNRLAQSRFSFAGILSSVGDEILHQGYYHKYVEEGVDEKHRPGNKVQDSDRQRRELALSTLPF